MDVSHLKARAAEYAVGMAASGMVVGLGHGSTALLAVRRLADLLREGVLHDVIGIPCSIDTEHEARRMGIPLGTLEDHPTLDLTIDGTDEVTSHLDCIKGGGGALLREKIVAQVSRREIIIADASKLTARLGTHALVPVEVASFGWTTQAAYLESLGALVTLRRMPDGSPFRTDQGNLILDGDFGPLDAPAQLAQRLDARAGIIAHGLFLGLATDVIIADAEGIRVYLAEHSIGGSPDVP